MTKEKKEEAEKSTAEKVKDQVEEKPQDEKTEQEKFVEGKAALEEDQKAAASGEPTPSGGPTGAAAGLAEPGAADKEITPPESAPEPPVPDEEPLPDEEEPEEVPFEPENDPRARLHGTHDAAMGGLQTDISGSYVPPGLVKEHETRQARREEADRLEDARYQEDQVRSDTGGRRTRL